MDNTHQRDNLTTDSPSLKFEEEVVEAWTQAPHIMSKHFKEAIKERPKDFMSKFLQGQD